MAAGARRARSEGGRSREDRPAEGRSAEGRSAEREGRRAARARRRKVARLKAAAKAAAVRTRREGAVPSAQLRTAAESHATSESSMPQAAPLGERFESR